jgi:hypothetical protein
LCFGTCILLKAIEQERRNRETEDLAREVEELREAVDLYNKGRDTWG